MGWYYFRCLLEVVMVLVDIITAEVLLVGSALLALTLDAEKVRLMIAIVSLAALFLAIGLNLQSGVESISIRRGHIRLLIDLIKKHDEYYAQYRYDLQHGTKRAEVLTKASASKQRRK